MFPDCYDLLGGSSHLIASAWESWFVKKYQDLGQRGTPSKWPNSLHGLYKHGANGPNYWIVRT